MCSVHGKLKGKKWSVWTEELGLGSPPGDTGLPDDRSLSPSSTLCRQDVMKLPKEEMPMYGQCPNWDRFVVVTCEKCKRRVKAEALESHVTLRHGSKSERNAYYKILASKAKTAFRTCQVKLTPLGRFCENEDLLKSCDSSQADILISGSSGSTSPTPSTSHPSTPPQFRGSSPSPFPTPTPPPLSSAEGLFSNQHAALSISAPETRSPSPDESSSRPDDQMEDMVEDLDIDFIDQMPGDEDMKDVSPVEPVNLPKPVIPLSPPIQRNPQHISVHPRPNIASLPARAPPLMPPASPRIPLAPSIMEGVEVSVPADSTTNNVISIPDTDDISNIEIDIISEDLETYSFNTKYNVTLMKPEITLDQSPSSKLEPPTTPSPARSTLISPPLNNPVTPAKPTTSLHSHTQISTLDNSPQHYQHNVTKPVSLPPRSSVFLSKPFKSSSSPKLDETTMSPQSSLSSTAPLSTIHYTNISPFSKLSPKRPVLLKAALDKKPSGREREYDPNKHCGVWDMDAKRHCTRSLTCKSHSVYLKRKVINRSGPFDQLLAAHKADKEALAVKVFEVGGSNTGGGLEKIDTGSSILARRLQPNLPNTQQQQSPKSWEQPKESFKMTNSLLKPNLTKHVLANQNMMTKDIFCDENLDYSVDHPKPLAVCTFGGKRLGGFFITDRPKFLTRKVMRIAISSVVAPHQAPRYQPGTSLVTGVPGVKRLGSSSSLVSVPVTSRQQTLPYLVMNVQGGVGATLAKPAGLVGGTLQQRLGMNGGMVQQQRLGVSAGSLQLESPSGPGQPHYIVQDAFKTDIQDFKGGIKFELGKNIHHVITSQDPGVSSA